MSATDYISRLKCTVSMAACHHVSPPPDVFLRVVWYPRGLVNTSDKTFLGLQKVSTKYTCGDVVKVGELPFKLEVCCRI